MLGDIEVKDTPAVVRYDEEHEKYRELRRRDCEEIDRHKIAKVLTEKGLPGG